MNAKRAIMHKDGDISFDGNHVEGFWHQGTDGNFSARGVSGEGKPRLVAPTLADLREQVSRFWWAIDE